MTTAGMFSRAVIIGFEIVIFACLIGFPEAGVFYWRKPAFKCSFTLKRFQKENKL